MPQSGTPVPAGKIAEIIKDRLLEVPTRSNLGFEFMSARNSGKDIRMSVKNYRCIKVSGALR